MWFTGYCCGVNGARTAAAVGRDDGNHNHDHCDEDHENYIQHRKYQQQHEQTVMGCTPSILSNGSNNQQQQQQSRKDSGLYVGNVAASGNGSNDTSNAAANNNKLSNSSPVNPTMVNAPYPGAASKDGGTEKESAKKDSIVSISATGHITSFPVVSTTVRRPTAGIIVLRDGVMAGSGRQSDCSAPLCSSYSSFAALMGMAN
uniref:Uncharacterized protein n=1 Tax=Anopheles culicifacies TaxID=139723 RepID=A0A182MPQ4_9DIPT